MTRNKYWWLNYARNTRSVREYFYEFELMTQPFILYVQNLVCKKNNYKILYFFRKLSFNPIFAFKTLIQSIKIMIENCLQICSDFIGCIEKSRNLFSLF